MSTIAVKEENKLSVKAQTLATIIAIVAAVVLPQIFHVMGAISGFGTALGEIFLPMHLPVILAGLLAGPYAGAVAGVCSPLVSFVLTQMPAAAVLPFMMIELCIYGLCAGLFRNAKMPTILKVAISQIVGRAVRAAAILVAIYGFANTAIPVASIWKSIGTGIFGIVLQWALLPLIVYRVDNAKRNEQ